MSSISETTHTHTNTSTLDTSPNGKRPRDNAQNSSTNVAQAAATVFAPPSPRKQQDTQQTQQVKKFRSLNITDQPGHTPSGLPFQTLTTTVPFPSRTRQEAFLNAHTGNNSAGNSIGAPISPQSSGFLSPMRSAFPSVPFRNNENMRPSNIGAPISPQSSGASHVSLPIKLSSENLFGNNRNMGTPSVVKSSTATTHTATPSIHQPFAREVKEEKKDDGDLSWLRTRVDFLSGGAGSSVGGGAARAVAPSSQRNVEQFLKDAEEIENKLKSTEPFTLSIGGQDYQVTMEKKLTKGSYCQPYLCKVTGQKDWVISVFLDKHKKDCVRYMANKLYHYAICQGDDLLKKRHVRHVNFDPHVGGILAAEDLKARIAFVKEKLKESCIVTEYVPNLLDLSDVDKSVCDAINGVRKAAQKLGIPTDWRLSNLAFLKDTTDTTETKGTLVCFDMPEEGRFDHVDYMHQNKTFGDLSESEQATNQNNFNRRTKLDQGLVDAGIMAKKDLEDIQEHEKKIQTEWLF
jgi:hypothetical protein